MCRSYTIERLFININLLMRFIFLIKFKKEKYNFYQIPIAFIREMFIINSMKLIFENYIFSRGFYNEINR